MDVFVSRDTFGKEDHVHYRIVVHGDDETEVAKRLDDEVREAMLTPPGFDKDDDENVFWRHHAETHRQYGFSISPNEPAVIGLARFSIRADLKHVRAA